MAKAIPDPSVGSAAGQVGDQQLLDEFIVNPVCDLHPGNDPGEDMVVPEAPVEEQVVLLVHVLGHQQLILEPGLDQSEHRLQLGPVALRLPGGFEVSVLAEAVEPDQRFPTEDGAVVVQVGDLIEVGQGRPI